MTRARFSTFAPTGPLLLLGLYLMAMLVQTALLAPSGRSDDLETLLLAQSLAWGYHAKNPPGFYWLAHGVMALTGASLPVVYALRLGGVFAMVAGLYALARRVQPDPLLAACAGFGVLATLHFHWYLMFHLTNTTLALALTPALLLAVLHVRDRGSLGAYALLGLAVGLGGLARYNFAILIAALLAAALSLREWRALVLRRRMLAAVAVAAALVAPHATWLARHAAVLTGHAGAQVVGDGSYPARVAEGLAELAEATASVLALPFGLAALVCFPAAFRRVRLDDAARASALSLIGRTIAAGLGLVAVYVLAGASYVRPHHLFFLVLAPVWLIGRLDRAALRPWAAPAFAAVLAACCLAAAVALPWETRRDAVDCGACEEFQPVATYARVLRTAGFERGTILALSRRQEFPTAALVGFFPGARLVAVDYTLYAPPPSPAPGDCLIVWSGTAEWPEGWTPGGPVPGLGLPLPPEATIGQVTGRLHLSGRPTPGMRYALVRGGFGDCR
jgi:4-amino-4-deoxy-L-arabinose transferase-like glycosyltransferase